MGHLFDSPLAKLAETTWHRTPPTPFDPELVSRVLPSIVSSPANLGILEFSGYLERYLWPAFDPKKATDDHVVSVAALIVRKCEERVPVWGLVGAESKRFAGLFRRAATECLSSSSRRSLTDRIAALRFFAVCATAAPACPAARDAIASERAKLIPGLLDDLLGRLENDEEDELLETYCADALELLADLLSRLATRRYLRPLLDDLRFGARCAASRTIRESSTLRRRLERVDEIRHVPIDDRTGAALSDADAS